MINEQAWKSGRKCTMRTSHWKRLEKWEKLITDVKKSQERLRKVDQMSDRMLKRGDRSTSFSVYSLSEWITSEKYEMTDHWQFPILSQYLPFDHLCPQNCFRHGWGKDWLESGFGKIRLFMSRFLNVCTLHKCSQNGYHASLAKAIYVHSPNYYNQGRLQLIFHLMWTMLLC